MKSNINGAMQIVAQTSCINMICTIPMFIVKYLYLQTKESIHSKHIKFSNIELEIVTFSHMVRMLNVLRCIYPTWCIPTINRCHFTSILILTQLMPFGKRKRK